jgi:hypothetical protein
MTFENLGGNIGNELIKKIFATAHRLDANKIVVHKAKYNKYAIVTLYEEPHGCICENYCISL